MTHHRSEGRSELQQAGFGAARDIEDFVGGFAFAPRMLARAMSRTWTKSIVCWPSPKMIGGRPASSRSIQRISTSV